MVSANCLPSSILGGASYMAVAGAATASVTDTHPRPSRGKSDSAAGDPYSRECADARVGNVWPAGEYVEEVSLVPYAKHPACSQAMFHPTSGPDSRMMACHTSGRRGCAANGPAQWRKTGAARAPSRRLASIFFRALSSEWCRPANASTDHRLPVPHSPRSAEQRHPTQRHTTAAQSVVSNPQTHPCVAHNFGVCKC